VKKPSILIATGGTGGHIFPGLAVADALRAMADVDVIFAGTPRGLEKDVVPERGYSIELLDVARMKGGGAARAVKGALIAARATGQALGLVRSIAPRAVLCIGGYAAGPVSLAAAALGIRVAVLEPNNIVGLANRLMAPLASRAYVAWEDTAKPFRKGVARLYGVPLRSGFTPDPYAPAGTARVLVMGGSQGAQAINERMPAAAARAMTELPDLEIVHQTGRDRDEAVRAVYTREGVGRVRVVPFLDDVARELARADLVIARSGAVTVAEIAAVGRAAILIPFPHAAADHQAKNALALERAGGAICLRQEAADPVRLGNEMIRLLGSDAVRARMAEAARAHGKPRAAQDVARDLLDLARIDLPVTRAGHHDAPHGLNGKSNGAGKRARFGEVN